MGFMDILKTAVGFVPAVGPAIRAGLDVAGSLGKGMQAGREKENTAANDAATFALRESQGAENALQNRQQLDLQQRQFGQSSQTDAYKKALMSSLVMNLKDASMQRPSHIPNMSFQGGLRPSALGPQGQEAAQAMNKLAMQKLLGGEQFDKLPEIERTAAPTYKKPGFWENTLGAVGTVGGAIGSLRDQQQQSDFQKSILEKIAALGQGRDTSGV